MDLSGQTILITGSARRIGRELALSAARAGADIIIHHGHSPKEADQTANEIRGFGRQAWVIKFDLVREDLDLLINQAWLLHSFDALVNNAAIFEPESWDTMSHNSWQRHLAINLTAPLFLSQAFAKQLGSHPGRIVNILDWRSLHPGADHFSYTISKAALASLTKSLALALAPNITVNGLALGAILPPSDGSNAQEVLEKVPIKRWADIEEVGKALIYLLTGPGYVTGDIIHLDGGRHLV
jgi:pteridine reductase